MSKVIAVCNQKGGVGKTTTAISLASYAAMSCYKTLIIDLDPQANASSGLGIDVKAVELSAYEALLDNVLFEDIIIPTEIDNLFIVPSSMRLTGAEIELIEVSDREQKLKQLIEKVKNDYDYIFVDTPPSLGLLTINALTAADSLIIPLQCEYYSLEGVSYLINTVNLVKENLNPLLEIEGILLTMADFRARLTGEVIDEIKTHFKDKVYETVIPRSIKIAESPGYGRPIFFYDPNSTGALKYKEVAEEFLTRNKKSKTIIEDLQEPPKDIDSAAGQGLEPAEEKL